MKSFLWILIFISFTTVTFARSAYKVVGNSVVINLDGFGVKSKLLKIEVWSQNTIRVTSTMNDTFSEKPSLFGELSTEPIKFKVSYAQTNIEITTSNIIVNIAEDGMLRILNRAGRKLLVESSRAYNLADSVGSAYKINQKFFLNRGEHIFGFGHENNITRHTLRSESFDVKQGKSSIATPTFFSEKGFAFIWDNYSATNFKDTPANLSITSDLADDIQYFVINGPDWNSIVAEIRNFTGAAPMLPKWAFGYHLNPETFSSPEQVNAAIKNYQSIGVPVENSVVDYSLYNEEKEITANNTNKRLQNAEAFFTLKEKYEKEQSQNKESRTIIPTHINL
ncbi:MAG: DUF4968 domain-containing protein, partial [Prolixibacteraceae bacterium]|nr:DUF4968 domain-containing protein [Prolixibacteraceae bacterium]